MNLDRRGSIVSSFAIRSVTGLGPRFVDRAEDEKAAYG